MAQQATLTLGTSVIHQHDGLYSLNDLHRASGGDPGQRPGNFLNTDQTQALVSELENAGISAFKSERGRHGGTYACRELVIAYAAWISAAFHLKVIRVFLAAAAPPEPALGHSPAQTSVPPDAQRSAAAYRAASEVAAQAARAAFDAVMGGGHEQLRGRRWTFGLDWDDPSDITSTRPWAKPVPDDAWVMSARELARQIEISQETLTTDELLALGAACNQRLLKNLGSPQKTRLPASSLCQKG